MPQAPRVVVSVIVTAFALAVLSNAREVLPPAYHLRAAPFDEWAVGHWVWLSSPVANQTSEMAFAQRFLDADIPVSAVDLDSEWATGNNNFVFDVAKYPNASAMVDWFHSQNIRVICWVTSMVDTDSSNFAEGLAAGYFLNEGKTVKWWHGVGAFLDYTNAAAVAWWHAQMDLVLDVGVDGWKTDGTDPYVLEFGVIRSSAGPITYREYADAYYGDFFNYTRQVRGFEALIMARPVDDLWSFAPRDVVFSGWVGDDDPTFDGMKSALWSMFHSAYKGYVGFGSDIGGYRCCDGKHGVVNPPLGRTVELFTRWFQMGAFCSLMENGGDNEHGPWAFGNETLTTYRLFATTHMELTPYLVSTGTVAYADGTSIMKPMAADVPVYPLRWDYLLGDDIFVFPMVENTTSADISFPDGANWVDWWSNAVYTGGSEVRDFPVPMTILPVFQRQGAILPLRVSSALTGHGDARSADALTLLLSHPAPGQREVQNIHYAPTRFDGLGRVVGYERAADGRSLRMWSTAHPERLILLLRGVDCPREARGVLGVTITCRTRDDFAWAPVEAFVSFAAASASANGLDMVLSW